MSDIAELLSRDQQDRVNRSLEALYGVGDSAPDMVAEAKEAGLTEILFADVPLLRFLEYSLLPHYIRLRDARGRVSACSASKIDKYVAQGWEPVTTLEGME